MAELRRAALRIPGLRGVALGSARYHVGTVTEARLGYQVVRILTSHAHRRARAQLLQRDRSSLARTLLADGIAVVPNFLDDSEFRTVRTACLRALAMSTEGPLRDRDDSRLRQTTAHLDLDAPDNVAIRRVAADPAIRAAAQAVMGTPMTGWPAALVDRFRAAGPEPDELDDIEGVLHSDLHVPTVKAWITLTPIDLESGPFVFAVGSQRLTRSRIAHEYRKSVGEAMLRAGRPVPGGSVVECAGERRVVLTNREHGAMAGDERFITAEPNTLIMTNNFGFHRRGPFREGAERTWLLLNFRRFNRAWA